MAVNLHQELIKSGWRIKKERVRQWHHHMCCSCEQQGDQIVAPRNYCSTMSCDWSWSGILTWPQQTCHLLLVYFCLLCLLALWLRGSFIHRGDIIDYTNTTQSCSQDAAICLWRRVRQQSENTPRSSLVWRDVGICRFIGISTLPRTCCWESPLHP